MPDGADARSRLPNDLALSCRAGRDDVLRPSTTSAAAPRGNCARIARAPETIVPPPMEEKRGPPDLAAPALCWTAPAAHFVSIMALRRAPTAEGRSSRTRPPTTSLPAHHGFPPIRGAA